MNPSWEMVYFQPFQTPLERIKAENKASLLKDRENLFSTSRNIPIQLQLTKFDLNRFTKVQDRCKTC